MRKLTPPPGVSDTIPPDATLHFDVRLVQINDDIWNSSSTKKVMIH
jgi:hypothetical protein